jgi:hypothetical protein
VIARADLTRHLAAAFIACTALWPAGRIAAQTPATAFVPADHWSVHAVDRLHAMGLALPGTVRGQRSRSVAEVLATFRSAADSGDEGALAWLRRFQTEFSTESAGPIVLTHASLAGGAGALEGDVAHGIYSTWGEENWTGARAREDRTAATGRGALLAGLGEYLAAAAIVSRGPLRTELRELYGVARIGPVGLWGGRRIQGYGPGTSGMVMTGSVPVDGAGIHLEPVRLPWLLRYLGPVRADITLALPDANGPVDRPWFVLTRGSIEPHPRLGFGVTRGGMIGAVDEDVSVLDVLLFLAGDHTDGSEFDNQVAAVDAWFRPPAGSIPLLLYVEWGAEDSAGSWWDVPGIIAGAELASVPGLPWLSVLVERSSFEGSNSGNPPWYRHPIGYHEGWSIRGELLGHPLGGHGQEWIAQARGHLLDGRLQLMTRGFARTRRAENVYAPERAGRSTGFAAEADLQLRAGIALQLAGSTESGSGWRSTALSGALQLHLPQSRR